jgi:hypothetical protein
MFEICFLITFLKKIYFQLIHVWNMFLNYFLWKKNIGKQIGLVFHGSSSFHEDEAENGYCEQKCEYKVKHL